MRLSARLILFVLAFFSLFLSFTAPIFAQDTQSPAQTFTNSVSSEVPQSINTLAQGILWGMLSFASCMISGTDITTPQQKCLGHNSEGKLSYVTNQKGLIGMMSSAITILYSPPPFHVGSYIGYLGNNFGLAKKTYAAAPTGPSGFEQLTPIMKLWITFRNVAYLLFVIVFIVIGFAIMLRAKIDPRTVMTIENQIPKIIVALLLVSFSYAIAGFVIDIMWLTTYVTINLFGSLDPAIQVGQMTGIISTNPLAVLDHMATGGILALIVQPASSVYDIILPMVKQIFNVPFVGGVASAMGGLPCLFQRIGNLISNPQNFFLGNNIDINKCMQDGFTAGVSGIAGVMAFLIFGIALAFALFRMWFTLLKSYALFLIYAIMGPFFIMLGVLPGTKINFDNWLRHLLAYSLVFPFAIGAMLLGKVISDVYAGGIVGYIPPLVGVTQDAVSPIGPLLGFTVILLIPQALTMLQDALSAPDLKYLPGIGQAMSTGVQSASTIMSKPWQVATRRADSLKGQSEGILRKRFMDLRIWPFGKGRTIRELAGEKEVKLQ